MALFKPVHCCIVILALASTGLILTGMILNTWIWRTSTFPPPVSVFTLATARERLSIHGDFWTTFELDVNSSLSLQIAVDNNVWTSSCSASQSGIVGLGDVASPFCNASSSTNLIVTCSILRTYMNNLKAASAPQAQIDTATWKYNAACPVGKATLSMWAVSGFMCAVSALIALLAAFAKLSSKAVLIVVIVTWLPLIAAFILGTYIGVQGFHVGYCDTTNTVNMAANVQTIGYCNFGDAYFFTIGGLGGMLICLILAIIYAVVDSGPGSVPPNKQFIESSAQFSTLVAAQNPAQQSPQSSYNQQMQTLSSPSNPFRPQTGHDADDSPPRRGDGNYYNTPPRNQGYNSRGGGGYDSPPRYHSPPRFPPQAYGAGNHRGGPRPPYRGGPPGGGRGGRFPPQNQGFVGPQYSGGGGGGGGYNNNGYGGGGYGGPPPVQGQLIYAPPGGFGGGPGGFGGGPGYGRSPPQFGNPRF